MQMKNYAVEIEVSDGELATTSHVIIQAGELKEAVGKAERVVKSWFQEKPRLKHGWWYFGDRIGRSVRVSKVTETTAETFLQSRLMAA